MASTHYNNSNTSKLSNSSTSDVHSSQSSYLTTKTTSNVFYFGSIMGSLNEMKQDVAALKKKMNGRS